MQTSYHVVNEEKKMNIIVPTSIDAEIGGHSGDGGALSQCAK